MTATPRALLAVDRIGVVLATMLVMRALRWPARSARSHRENGDPRTRAVRRTRDDTSGPVTAWHVQTALGGGMAIPMVTASARVERRGEPTSRLPARCRRKFLHYFPSGFRDETYFDWERGYKEKAHARWNELLHPRVLGDLVRARKYDEVAERAVKIEARTNLLFSFEKMAVRDALRTDAGARDFAVGLLDLVAGKSPLQVRFERWIATVGRLPRKKTRVLTWPVATVFGFLARPDEQIFLKPTVTRRASEAYGFEFAYASRPNWETYASLLAFAARIRRDMANLRPRDMIDLQSFIWVQGSDEYPWRG